MAQKNRNMAAKALKAARQKSEFGALLRAKAEANTAPLSPRYRLIAALASRADIVSIAGCDVHRCDDVAARKAARQTIRSVHW